MNKVIILAICMAALAMLAGCTVGSPSQEATSHTIQPLPDLGSGSDIKSTGTTNPGEMQVDLKSNGFSDGKLTFDIWANTHSVNIAGTDFKDITTLELNGKKLKPVSAPTISGHHTTGKLVFDVAGEPEGPYKVIITGIPKTENREYEWE